MSEICAFEAKAGTRIVGRGGVIFEVVELEPMQEGHDVVFTIRGPDGQKVRVGMDMWTKLTLATVLDEMAQ